LDYRNLIILMKSRRMELNEKDGRSIVFLHYIFKSKNKKTDGLFFFILLQQFFFYIGNNSNCVMAFFIS